MPGALTAGLNWYRASMRPQLAGPELPSVGVDTLGIWSSGDRYLVALPLFHVGALTPITSNVHRGVTSVVITQDMASVFQIASRVNMLYEGRIEASGTPDDILASRNPVGSPSGLPVLLTGGCLCPRRRRCSKLWGGSHT